VGPPILHVAGKQARGWCQCPSQLVQGRCRHCGSMLQPRVVTGDFRTLVWRVQGTGQGGMRPRIIAQDVVNLLCADLTTWLALTTCIWPVLFWTRWQASLQQTKPPSHTEALRQTVAWLKTTVRLVVPKSPCRHTHSAGMQSGPGTLP
jgi:hypothetical protein